MITSTKTTTMRTTSMQTTSTSTSLPLSTTSFASVNNCVSHNPSTQYCYTLPESYGALYDAYDNDANQYYVDPDFNAGNTFTFSKICSGDWYWAGENNRQDGSFMGCDDILIDSICHQDINYLLSIAVPSTWIYGYVTPLNCPICGCTPGENDVIKMHERNVGARSTGKNRENIFTEMSDYLKATKTN